MLIFILHDIDAAKLDLINKLNVSRAPVRIYSVSGDVTKDARPSKDRPGDVICIGGDVPLEDVL